MKKLNIFMKTKILHEDAHLLVIHKPAGIAVQSARIGQMDVESELKNYLSTPYLGLVHRLDQPVEGLLVVAKTREAAAKLNKLLAVGSLNKKYLAVVSLEQQDVEDSGELLDYMIKNGQVARIVEEKQRDEARVPVSNAGISNKTIADIKEARLCYKLIKKADDLALADIQIETGRFHQIRCQMAHHGMPLLGDSKYGSSESAARSIELGIKNVALCANRISFKHPISGKLMEFQVEPANPAFAKFL